MTGPNGQPMWDRPGMHPGSDRLAAMAATEAAHVGPVFVSTPLFDPGSPARHPSRAWAPKVCGDPGPYCVKVPSAKNYGRLRVLTCTRPAGHDGDFHQAVDDDGRILAQWGRDGRPGWPSEINQRKGTDA